MQIVIRRDATEAVKHPSNLNLGTNFDTKRSINPFTKKRKIPKVIIVMGKVKKMKIGRITAFTKASTSADKKAVPNPSILYNFVMRPTV